MDREYAKPLDVPAMARTALQGRWTRAVEFHRPVPHVLPRLRRERRSATHHRQL